MKIVEQIREHPMRFVKTLALYLAYITLGLNMGIVGPTLLDLQIAIENATLEDITWVNSTSIDYVSQPYR